MLNINNGFHCGIVGFCMKQSWLNVMARRAGRAHCRMRIFLPLSFLWALSCTTGGSHGLLSTAHTTSPRPPKDVERGMKRDEWRWWVSFWKLLLGDWSAEAAIGGEGGKQGGLFVALYHTHELHSLALQNRVWGKWPVWTNRRVVSFCESLIRSLQIMLFYLGVRVECFVIVCGLTMNKSLMILEFHEKPGFVFIGNKCKYFVSNNWHIVLIMIYNGL